jgi:hypothetical protein
LLLECLGRRGVALQTRLDEGIAQFGWKNKPLTALTTRKAGGACRRETRPDREERMMKLTSTQVERALSQFDAQAVPENHPMVPQLNELFGEHTFFLDGSGLNIVEPTAEARQMGVQTARIVNLANWGDASLTSLAPHDPEPTESIVDLGVKH